MYDGKVNVTRRNKNTNPYCPVAGCKTNKRHVDDAIVNGLMHAFAAPTDMTQWVLTAMAELSESICRDLQDRKMFAFHTRARQPEELYIRTLYALFVATDEELPHILSGEMPNSLSSLYEKVNKVVFDGRGLLQVKRPGLTYGTFKPMDILNDSAHASFHAMMSCIGLVRNPENVPSLEKCRKYLKTYCDNLHYMHLMFKEGKEKVDVLAGIKNRHQPPSSP
jgi:hypothetical protein